MLVDHCSADFQELVDIPLSSSFPESSERKPIYKTLSAPLESQVELTTACNRNCIHCYNYWRQGKDHSATRALSDEEISSTIDQLERAQVFHLTVTGGEPLLFKEKAFRLIKEATARGIECNLNSNLFSVTSDDAVRLKEAGVSFVLASLPSADPQTHDSITQRQGSFKETLRGIEVLLQAGVKVGVNMVISKLNQDQIYDTGRFLRDVGVVYFYATKASPPLNSQNFETIRADTTAIKESLSILASLSSEFGMITDILECYPLCLIGDVEKFAKFARHKCRGGITNATISANGDLKPCSHSDQVYGNIFSHSLDKAWLNMNEWRDGSLIPESCLSCAHFQRCSGGCRMEAKYYGKINGMDPLAPGSKELILPNLGKMQEKGFEQFTREKLSISSDLRKRREKFGGILKGDRNYVFVNEGLWNLIDILSLRASFTTEDIARNFGYERAKILEIFRFLWKEEIVTEI